MQRVAQDWIGADAADHTERMRSALSRALQFAPQLLLLAWSGLAADRFKPVKLLMLTQHPWVCLRPALES